MLDSPDMPMASQAPSGGAGDPIAAIAQALGLGGEQPTGKLYNVTTIRRETYGCAKVYPVPPEEFGISRNARMDQGVKSADYCFHETKKSAREIIAMGFDSDQVRALPVGSALDQDQERQARDTVNETSEGEDSAANWVTRQHPVTEHYVRMDYEDDGTPRLYRVTTAGSAGDILKRDGKLAIDEIDEMPFAAMTPVIITHRFYGRSVADLVMDIQRIKTALLRSLLDNIYLANNQRLEVAQSHAVPETIDDVLSNRPGGIVRTSQPGGITPIPNQEIGSFAYPMLEYQDSIREWRTGVTKQGQGIDAKALQDQSATAAQQMFTMAQARMRLVARIFAETGIRDMFLLLHSTIRRNDREENTVRLRNKWVTVAPQEWQRRKDMTVRVGVGSGGKAQQMAFLMQLLGIQMQGKAAGSQLVDDEKIYHTLAKIVENGDLKSVEPYFNDPATQQQAQGPPPPDPKMVEVQQKAQADAAQAQATIAIQMQKMQADFALKKEQMDREFALRQQQQDAELQLKYQQMMMQAATRAAQVRNPGAGDTGMGISPIRFGGMPG